MVLKGLSKIRTTLLSLSAILVATGVVLATSGSLLNAVVEEQDVNMAALVIEPNAFEDALFGTVYGFTVTVTNPIAATLGNVNLQLRVTDCPTGVSGALTETSPVVTPTFLGNVCANERVSSTASIAGLNDFAIWTFEVVFEGTPQPGVFDVEWRVEAHLEA